MRIVQCLSLVSMFAIGCADASSDPPDGGPGPGDDAGPVCTSGVSDEILHLTTATASRESLAVGDGIVGVAYSDGKGAINLGIVDADGNGSSHVLTNPVPRTKYKDYDVQLAYAQGHFGVAFDFERTTTANVTEKTNWPSVAFTTVDAASGVPSDIYTANNDIDRTGGGGGSPVQAWQGTPIPTSNGFFVTWSDMRTAEPIQYDTNLAGWTGIYGFGFTLAGDLGMSDDVQVQQTSTPYGFTGVSTSKGILAAWGGTDTNGTEARLYTRLGPASGEFTPGGSTTPIAKIASSYAERLTAAVGPDKNVLIVFEVESLATRMVGLYTMLVGPSGNLVAQKTFAQHPKLSYGMTSLVATSSGYVLAYASGPLSTTTSTAAYDTIHVVSLDATGADVGASTQTLIDGGLQGANLAVSADDTGRSVVWFLSEKNPELGAPLAPVTPTRST